MTLDESKTIYCKTKVVIFAVLAVLGLAGFAYLTYEVYNFDGVEWLDIIRFNIYEMRSPGLNTFAEGITYLGEWYSITAICLLALIYPKTRFKIGIPISVVAITTQILMKIAKHIVLRERPDKALHLIEQGGYSFPSGHSITSIAVYGMLFLLILWYFKGGGKKVLLLCLTGFLTFAIGLSRIYLGVHYPSDVAAGWCLGIAISAITLIIVMLIEHKRRPSNAQTCQHT